MAAARPAPYGQPNANAGIPEFTETIGALPFCEPNVRPGLEREDLQQIINGGADVEAGGHSDSLWACFCCLTGVGSLYLCSKGGLINQGSYGFALDNGRPAILFPGWYLLASPFISLLETDVNAGRELIQAGPVTIVRISQGQLGFALNNGQPELLLPGVHCRNSTAFKYSSAQAIDQDLCVFGPIKLLMVRSGTVRVCYHKGQVRILKEGRYAINDGTFQIANIIMTQQQNIRLKKHPVLLDGGIGLLVEGLLTFQVVDTAELVRELGERDLLRAIEDVTKAEISRVFAAIHLEQISAAQQQKFQVSTNEEKPRNQKDEKQALLGSQKHAPGETEGESRSKICHHVIEYITPIVARWGVRIVNFQLESTKIADEDYARDYEIASLGMAKAKANMRSVEAENELLLQKARAAASALTIASEGKGQSMIIEARSIADARKIEAAARNEAANAMPTEFAQTLALMNQQVAFAKNLQSTNITMTPNTALAQPLLDQFGPGGRSFSII